MPKIKIQVGEKTMVSLKEASQHTTYTRDYLAKLAREKKIEAKHIGRQWFVDLDSLNDFVKKVSYEQEERKLRLREERKRERLTKQKLITLSEEKQLKVKALSLYSLYSSLSVLVFGIFAGTIFYTHFNFSVFFKTDFVNHASIFLAQKDKNNNSTDDINLKSQKPVGMGVEFVEYPLFVDRSETRVLSDSGSGILLLPQVSKRKEELKVDELFSDSVEAEFTTDNGGVLTYTKQNGEKMEISFVSIPNSFTEKDVSKNNSP